MCVSETHQREVAVAAQEPGTYRPSVHHVFHPIGGVSPKPGWKRTYQQDKITCASSTDDREACCALPLLDALQAARETAAIANQNNCMAILKVDHVINDQPAPTNLSYPRW